MPTEIKICGLSDEESVDAAIEAGADLIGFVFFRATPRYVSPARAAELAERARGRVRVAALAVEPDDALVAEIGSVLRPDLLQLHGKESAERVAAIRSATGLPVMKAFGIASRDDLIGAEAFGADKLLLDAKPPRDGTRPGGNGASFDWSLVAGFAPGRPWLLSGGLNPSNVAEAIRISRAPGVDVSSGVESAPGRKDPELIRRFVEAVRASEKPLRRAG